MKEKGSSLCKYCRNHIEQDAVICTNCGQYQNWRSYLNFSHSIIALLIALISVLTVAVPVFIKIFQKNDSEIVISYMYPEIEKKFNFTGENPYTLDDFKLVLIASNLGNRPGAIRSASLIFSHYFYDLTIEGSRVIEPGKTEIIKLTGDPYVYYQFGYEGREIPYTFSFGFDLKFNIQNFSNLSESVNVHIEKILNKETYTHSKMIDEIMEELEAKKSDK